MATTPTQTHPQLFPPLSAATDFITLADYCERFAEALTENRDPTLQLTLCGRLTACLTRLRATQNDPIPAHLTSRFITDSYPIDFPRFEPDTEQLCGYSIVLTQALTDKPLSPESKQTLADLLFGLVSYLTAELKTPRWVRTADGIEPICEEER